MTSSREKGNYYERKTVKKYEADGWIVERALAKIVWIHGRPISLHHDFFGKFDLICVKGGRVLFVQVKFVDGRHDISPVRLLKEYEGFPSGSGTRILEIWKKEGSKVGNFIHLI